MNELGQLVIKLKQRRERLVQFAKNHADDSALKRMALHKISTINVTLKDIDKLQNGERII